MKRISVVLPIIATVFLTGCLDGLSEPDVSCSGSDEQQLVKDITLKSIVDEITCQKQLEKNGKIQANSMMAQASINMCRMMLNGGINGLGKYNKKAGLDTLKESVNEQVSKSEFKITGVRTISNDDKLAKVECKATIEIDLPSFEQVYTHEIAYNAQLSDDKQNVYVEVTEF